jgi:hypothetical protein
MEYKRLNNLQNTYPQTGNYISDQFLSLTKVNGLLQYDSNQAQEKAKINLFGRYADKNVLPFTTKTLKNLNYVESTNFRFILAIFKDYNDTSPAYYTSQTYYNDLNAALIEGNPYFLQASFDSANIVSFVYEDVVNIAKNAVPLELKSRVDFRTNIFITNGSFEVNYSNLVRFIDWLVDKPSPVDDINDGVLQAETIAGWNELNGDWVTGKVLTTVSASYGIGKEFVIIQEEINTKNLDAANVLLAKGKLEQSQIEGKIKILEEEIRTQTSYRYPFDFEGAYAVVNKEFTDIEGKVNKFVKKYKTKLFFYKPKEKRREGITQEILKDVNTFKKDLDAKKQEVATLTANVNEEKKKVNDIVDKAKAAKAKADEALKSLNGMIPTIPKIPKLPAIPKIPKLPAASDLLALLPLPVLPVLPKLPALPKFGKPKLPKVPKIKLKKPKEPKKVKKNKGKGLKGALAGLQDAANKVQGSIAAATAAAAGATAAVVGAAAAAKSAVANAQNAVANAQSTVKGAVDSAKAAADGAVNSVKGAVDSAKAAADGAVNSVKGAVSNIENAAKEEVGKLKNK